MFILLIGPKGCGKTYLGQSLERVLGVRFFHVEPLWMAWNAECRGAGRAPNLAGGIAAVHPKLAEALGAYEHVCVETTGASREILEGLLALQPRTRTLLVRISAPLDVCLERIAARDATHQLPADEATIRKVHALSEALELDADLSFENAGLAEATFVERVAQALRARAED
ncbi:MAG: hypothetical protein M5U26_10130 [Planctomycetota bacterium]|nr:hypothetical protein [Planctomycetota bacterium]